MTALPQLTRVPRDLPMLSDHAKAALDPYMAQIVGYRKSGLSLNHIIGCPLDCAYCVRHFWGNFEVKVPHLLCSTDEAIDRLLNHEAFQPHITPIQLLNKATDSFVPAVKPHLFQILRALDERGYTNHVLVITRFHVTERDMAELEQLKHLRVTLLFTYSGITDDRIEPIAKSETTIKSIRTAATFKRRTGVVLYWRPIVPGWNDQPATMAAVLDLGRVADAIVFTGLYHKKESADYMRALGIEVPYGEDYHRRKTMPRDLDNRVVSAWRQSGISTPLFRKTSCGVAYAHGTPDYNGHWGVRELCDICPAKQQKLCADDYREPTAADMDTVLAQLGYETHYVIEPGHVWTHGLGEQRRYAIQHTLRHQIWELDQPHYLHAHGRSLNGHTAEPEQVMALAGVRKQFEQTARYEDD
ncbi:radical SAM protein [Micromonospora thermarum]|nr:radical SAM protein [Micromonospora thermarum]